VVLSSPTGDTKQVVKDATKQLGSLMSSDVNTSPPDPSVNVVLCWSEFFNGKWQAMKTSDVSNPMPLGNFPVPFDRSILVVRSYEAEGSLRISVEVNEAGRGEFRLFNTHSLPLSRADAAPMPQGKVAYSGVFAASGVLYFVDEAKPPSSTNPFSRQVFRTPSNGSTLEPRHPLVDGWTAPFFSDDPRHVFFVTSSYVPVQIKDHVDVGTTDINSQVDLTVTIPQLVVPVVNPSDPEPWIADSSARSALSNAAAMQHVFATSPTIRQGIGASGTVKFGDASIGPVGNVNFNVGKV